MKYSDITPFVLNGIVTSVTAPVPNLPWPQVSRMWNDDAPGTIRSTFKYDKDLLILGLTASTVMLSSVNLKFGGTFLVLGKESDTLSLDRGSGVIFSHLGGTDASLGTANVPAINTQIDFSNPILLPAGKPISYYAYTNSTVFIGSRITLYTTLVSDL